MGNIKQGTILRFNPIVTDSILNAILQTGSVKIYGLGVIKVKHMKARKGFNPGSKKIQVLPSYHKLVFNPTKQLKDKIKNYGTK